jgi:hypothetical protein
MPLSIRKQLVNDIKSPLSIRTRAHLLRINRSSLFYRAKSVSTEQQRLHECIIDLYTKRPALGYRRINGTMAPGLTSLWDIKHLKTFISMVLTNHKTSRRLITYKLLVRRGGRIIILIIRKVGLKKWGHHTFFLIKLTNSFPAEADIIWVLG